MERGRIVERGRHDELVASGGLYSRLVTEQVATEGSSTIEAAFSQSPPHGDGNGHGVMLPHSPTEH
jgi:hypothetical protein